MDIQRPFNLLPAEIKLEIFNNLDISDLRTIERVNEQWRKLAPCGQSWESVGREIGLPKKVLKLNSKGAVQEEVERVKKLAKDANITTKQPVTAANIRMLKLSAQIKFLKKYKEPPESVKKLLTQPPTSENLHILESWLEARTTFIVYRELNKDIRSENPINSNILQTDNWVKIPELYAKWSEENSEKLKSITYLNLQDQQISSLPKGIFQNLVNLETLDLRNNQIRFLEKGFIQNLVNLKKLDLSFNQISFLDKGFIHTLVNLTELDLSHNQISSVDKGFLLPLVNLRKLDLSSNQIRSLDKEFIKTLINLSELNLFGNEISFLDKEILETLENLYKIDLSNNKIYSLPEGLFQNLKSLKWLELYFNKISPDNKVINQLRNKGITISLKN